MIHRIMLIVFPYVVPRSAVASAQIDFIRMPRGVSSRQNCRDLSDSRGHVSTLVLLVSVCFHVSSDAQLVSDMFVFNRSRCYYDDAKRARSGVQQSTKSFSTDILLLLVSACFHGSWP